MEINFNRDEMHHPSRACVIPHIAEDCPDQPERLHFPRCGRAGFHPPAPVRLGDAFHHLGEEVIDAVAVTAHAAEPVERNPENFGHRVKLGQRGFRPAVHPLRDGGRRDAERDRKLLPAPLSWKSLSHGVPDDLSNVFTVFLCEIPHDFPQSKKDE